MEKSLESLVINEKGEITTSDGKVISELQPVGKPGIMSHNKLGPRYGIGWWIKGIDYPSEANAYLMGKTIYTPLHEYTAVQFYKIKEEV